VTLQYNGWPMRGHPEQLCFSSRRVFASPHSAHSVSFYLTVRCRYCYLVW